MDIKNITGRIDTAGRLLLSKKIRKQLGYEDDKVKLQICLDGSSLKIKKVDEIDIFTEEQAGDLVEYQGKKVSKETIKELVKLI
jgi:transcriptional pleiotropic regulator of transition state genes